MMAAMISGRACQGIVAALTGRSLRCASALPHVGLRYEQPRAAFSSEPPEGEELSEEAKAAMEAEAKRTAAEEHAARVKEFNLSRKTFKMEMSKVRKDFMQESAQKAEKEASLARKDTKAEEEEQKARREARRARSLANIEAHEARAAAARLEKAKVKELKAERRLQREAFVAEATELRRQLLAHQSRAWVSEAELEDRIMLALKYPDNLR